MTKSFIKLSFIVNKFTWYFFHIIYRDSVVAKLPDQKCISKNASCIKVLAVCSWKKYNRPFVKHDLKGIRDFYKNPSFQVLNKVYHLLQDMKNY